MTAPDRRRARGPTPGQAILLAFGGAIVVGTLVLMLPVARAGPERAPLLDALFTATSAVCVTGLVVVDTGTYWSGFGQVVVIALVQLGGLGLMTVASLLVVLVSRRLGLRARLAAQAQSRSVDLADVRRVLRNVVLFTAAVELAAAVVLTSRFALGHGMPVGRALYEGVFHGIAAFNNSGFVLRADSLTAYAGDPTILLTVALAVIVGGLGFPVVFELARAWRRPRTWSVVTRITVAVTTTLLVLSTLAITALEWANAATLGAHGTAGRVLHGFFAATMTRTAGFNAVDVGAMRTETWLVTDILMFIGGGSAGTAGGIKVTTFGLLALVLWAEIRGEPDVDVGARRIPLANQREALAVALLGVGLVAVATLALQITTGLGLDRVLFEAISALSTTGLTTGVTSDLTDPARVVVVILMFVGRLGPLAVASALALRTRPRHYRRPEERTIIG